MDAQILLIYRRSASKVLASILKAYLQLIELSLLAEARPVRRDHALIVLTPSALERCAEPKDAMRTVLRDLHLRNARFIALISPYFDPAEQARYAADLPLSNAEALRLDYADWDRTLENLQGVFGSNATLPPLRAAQRAQLDAQAWFERALSLPADDLAGKFAAYGEALRSYPEFAEAYARRGGAHLANGDLAACLADCEAALRLNPNLPEAYHVRAMAQARQQNYAEAIAGYTAALRTDPRNARLYVNRGAARANAGDLDGAIEDYSAALDLNPRLAEAYFNRSLAYSLRDNFEAAIQDYAQAMALNLNTRQAADAADIGKTVAYLERMLARFPDHPKAEAIKSEIERLRGLAAQA
jgi:tetratricopeptide (TPR) repeat protein